MNIYTKKLFSLFFILSFSSSTLSFQIRISQEEDRPGIRKILEQDLDTHYIIDGPINHYDAEVSLSSTLYTALDNEEYKTLVAEKSNIVVGFITYKSSVDFLTKLSEWFFTKKIRMVQHMGVHKNYQRQGIGKNLIKSMSEELKLNKVDCIMLCVITKNTKARTFYEKQGFYISHPTLEERKQSDKIIEALKKRPQLYYRLDLYT